jgi:hypothetical protein
LTTLEIRVSELSSQKCVTPPNRSPCGPAKSSVDTSASSPGAADNASLHHNASPWTYHADTFRQTYLDPIGNSRFIENSSRFVENMRRRAIHYHRSRNRTAWDIVLSLINVRKLVVHSILLILISI